MKVIILSAVAALVLAYAASFVLFTQQRPAYEVFVGSGARVGDDPGTNLVGPDWDGQNNARAPQS
jgi:acetyltransferase-like isoleucine patch superfamily enzyme